MYIDMEYDLKRSTEKESQKQGEQRQRRG